MDWDALATINLNGGEIGAIAHEAVLYAAATDAPKLTMEHILQVLSQKGKTLKLPKPSSKKGKAKATPTKMAQRATNSPR
jgi:hypothetical protein